MKTIAPHRSMALSDTFLLVLVCLSLCSCGPALVRVMKEDPRDNTRYVSLDNAELAGEANVYRGGRRLPVGLPYRLQSGDVIQTGPDAVAIVRLPAGNEIILDSNTRVRLGSFFVEFGRILSRVRGFFEAESENVIAGVEGTEFVFEVTQDRAVAVTVLDGNVVCRSKTRGWQVRLNRGEVFYSQHPNLVNPGKRLATPTELDDIRRWIQKIEGTSGHAEPESGYCCLKGEVFHSSRENCRGTFFLDLDQAKDACPSPPPDDYGYCCSGGRVYRATAKSCRDVRGVFEVTESEAYRRCHDVQLGFCCRDGKVTETSRSRCTGSFFTDSNEAQKNCPPGPETGYCCLEGKVFQSTREKCKGKFFLDLDQAKDACPRPPPDDYGYCCSGGRVYRATAKSCRGVRGVFASTESEAYRRCPDAQPGYCCRDGQVTKSSRSRCTGSFFTDRNEALKNCPPKPEPGYCCLRGEVFPSTREKCTGKFFLDQAQARKACRSSVPEKPSLPTDLERLKPYERPVIR